MIGLAPQRHPLRILCLGAHPDDIEIGCGGTLLEIAADPSTEVSAVVMTGSPARREEAERSLPQYVPGIAVRVLDFPDGRLPAHWDAVKDALEGVAESVQPDIILAPRPDDAHQDHRLLGTLSSTVWRDSLLLHYEIPKWDADLGRNSHYVPVSRDNAMRKVELLNKHYSSQIGRDWWDDEMFLGLMRLRGVECRSRYAEAFLAVKVTVDLTGGGGRA